MDDSNPIRALDGVIPFLTLSSQDREGWFGLNHEAGAVSREISFSYAMDPRNENARPRTPSGRFEGIDWATDPDWYRPSTHWRGWIPVKDPMGRLESPPYLDFDNPLPYMHNAGTGTYLLERDSALEARDYYQLLDTIIDGLASAKFASYGLQLPPDVNIFDITDGYFETEEEAINAGAALRRGIADRLGWIAWIMAAVPEEAWAINLPFQNVGVLKLIPNRQYIRRGYLLSLKDVWQEANIGLWLSHGVPIFYQWMFDSRSVPELSRMHPGLIANNMLSDGQISSHFVPDNEELRTAQRSSLLYDDFFQLRAHDETFEVMRHQLLELDTEFFIIDFENWGRCRLRDIIDIKWYLSCFNYRVDNPPDMRGLVVTVWRWRKRPKSVLDRFDAIDTHDLEFNEVCLREIYKDRYAPRPGSIYDKETGVPINQSDFQEPTSTEIAVINDRPFSEGMGCGDSDLRQGNSGSSLRLISRVDEEGRNNEIENNAFVMSPWSSGGRQERGGGSASRLGIITTYLPPDPWLRPLESDVPQLCWPFTLFRPRLRQFPGVFTYGQQLYPSAVDLRWNPELLKRGVLIFPDPRSEVRFRCFSDCVTAEIRQIGVLLTLALEHRFAFCIAIKDNDLAAFAPRVISQAERSRGLMLYSPNYREPGLVFSTPTAFHYCYVNRVAELLSRPHAAAFVGMGGSYSWLAQRWGGDALVRRFMQGPSVQSTVFRKGASDITAQEPQNLLWDDISGTDIEILFGYVAKKDHSVQDRWLYPPPHFIEAYCPNWSGEWNEVIEIIFCYVTSEFNRKPCALRPMSRGSWREWLSGYNSRHLGKSRALTDNKVKEFFQGNERIELPHTWSFRPLSSILTPESSG